MSHSEAFRRSRRRFLAGGLATGLAGTTWWLRPQVQATGHTPYFMALNDALEQAGLARPTLVVDRQRLLANLARLRHHLGGRYQLRLVAKSLPSLPLLKELMTLADTRRLMVFHQPFLNQLAREIHDADLLLGKPLPVAAARAFFERFSTECGCDEAIANGGFDPGQQIQWLVDNPARLQQYAALAAELTQPMRINIELDIGLHRGGIQNLAELTDMLSQIQASPWLSFSGFMGYEPHIVKVPGRAERWRDRAMARYQSFVTAAEAQLGHSIAELTLNSGGSTTYQLYRDAPGTMPVNELAVGSALVMPTDFDLPTLADHTPAAFIATPVLKVMARNQIPGAPGLGRLQQWWNPNRAQALFIYGGNWLALPASPPGLTPNPVYGRSSNQELLNAPATLALRPDDRVFLRPTQSEHVFLQFGDIAIYDSDRTLISGYWPVLG
ncbi:MAG: DSD1 family PLP-dependent enzyme [Marinobacter sp.]|nr:DSD1 family PLP-dependent enzyme [Marinobacter sp.]